MKFRFQGLQSNLAILVGFGLILALASPAIGTTLEAGKRGNYRGQCRQLTRQINHFEGTILPLAIARGNRDWERATNEQVARLWHRRADLCPAYGTERTLLARARDRIRKFNQFVAVVGRGALAFFTGGLSGGL